MSRRGNTDWAEVALFMAIPVMLIGVSFASAWAERGRAGAPVVVIVTAAPAPTPTAGHGGGNR